MKLCRHLFSFEFIVVEHDINKYISFGLNKQVFNYMYMSHELSEIAM